ncbi:DUF397 domain-containing protein [Actinomadura sp. DC4]|uniref:DUF397 domain-containing protein n=1 Tax=Actinomadura sp. DC4 TaxID=3055069 RepID=UPI00339D3BB1
MNARWRKSSHSGHAGENCVEIALSMDRNANSGAALPPRNHRRTGQRPLSRASAWTVSQR